MKTEHQTNKPNGTGGYFEEAPDDNVYVAMDGYLHGPFEFEVEGITYFKNLLREMGGRKWTIWYNIMM